LPSFCLGSGPASKAESPKGLPVAGSRLEPPIHCSQLQRCCCSRTCSNVRSSTLDLSPNGSLRQHWSIVRPNRARATSSLGLGTRLLIGASYLAVLSGMAVWAHQGWPPATGAGLWFYSAAITVLLSVFVSEPFYTSPKTALTNAAALFLVVLTADRSGLQASSNAVAVGRIGLLVAAATVFLAAVAAITTETRAPKLNAIAFPIAITFGAGYVLYSLTYAAGVYGAFAHSPSRLALLLGRPGIPMGPFRTTGIHR
jgi:hypothetical protein